MFHWSKVPFCAVYFLQTPVSATDFWATRGRLITSTGASRLIQANNIEWKSLDLGEFWILSMQNNTAGIEMSFWEFFQFWFPHIWINRGPPILRVNFRMFASTFLMRSFCTFLISLKVSFRSKNLLVHLCYLRLIFCPLLHWWCCCPWCCVIINFEVSVRGGGWDHMTWVDHVTSW